MLMLIYTEQDYTRSTSGLLVRGRVTCNGILTAYVRSKSSHNASLRSNGVEAMSRMS